MSRVPIHPYKLRRGDLFSLYPDSELYRFSQMDETGLCFYYDTPTTWRQCSYSVHQVYVPTSKAEIGAVYSRANSDYEILQILDGVALVKALFDSSPNALCLVRLTDLVGCENGWQER